MLSIKYLNSTQSTIRLSRNLYLYKRQIRCQSTENISKNENEKKTTSPEYPLLDTQFNQYRIAYRYRRSMELLRGYLVYRLFSINFLVNNQAKLAEWGQKMLGARLFKSVLKLTAFGHFVGGETPEEIRPVIQRLQKYGVKPILDYSVESDDAPASETPEALEQSRRMHDHNTDKFIECIKTSNNTCGPYNLIAIKVTALIRPSVLKKFNHLLKSIDDRSSLPSIFQLINQNSDNQLTNQAIQSYLNKKQTDLASTTMLSDDEFTEVYQLLLRLNRIAQACIEQKVSIMVDAEQTYFQIAINYLANELQRYYNKDQIAYIYGTYQCYLKETAKSLKADLAQAEKYDYVFAAKLVRGAYMEQERRLAREYGYEDPINSNFDVTSKMYHACLDEVLANIVKRPSGKVKVMVASHNEDTIRYAIQKMKDNQIRRGSSVISFASLYGMSDYVAFALANSGYKTYKYLPYGPIESLQPYLFRRAQENRAMFEKAEKDRRLHFKALKDRVIHLKT